VGFSTDVGGATCTDRPSDVQSFDEMNKMPFDWVNLVTKYCYACSVFLSSFLSAWHSSVTFVSSYECFLAVSVDQ